MITRQQLQQFYCRACELDVLAFKPGNVSIYADGHSMKVEDFQISATVSCAYLSNPEYSLGEKIYYAVKATREAVGCNTNLGILLLCAPLMEAAYQCNAQIGFRQALAGVLQNTSVADAEWVFQAITLAAPGGLGASEDQDVSSKATITLTQAMQIASERDRIALQYVSNFKDVFDFGVIRYNNQLSRWDMPDWATVSVYTGLLSQFPDSHIERKYGCRHSAWVAAKMNAIDRILQDSNTPEQLESIFRDVDREFKEQGINPGTTADLTVATVLAVLIMGWEDTVKFAVPV